MSDPLDSAQSAASGARSEPKASEVQRGSIGICCNPASGKDVRRLAARASVFDNQEKQAIVRRAVVGAIAAGARSFRFVPDTHDLAANALAEFAGEIDAQEVAAPRTGSVLDTMRGAASLQAAGCGAVITLGGDGTNRAFATAWRDAPLLPVSTGTNNVFPRFVEATLAGAAAGFVATGRAPLAECARRAKAVSVEIAGEKPDLALIDAVLTQDRFVGARALLDADRLVLALLTRADPAGVGITSIGGLIEPVGDEDDAALLLEFGDGAGVVHAPIAPGFYQDVRVRSVRRVAFGEAVELSGAGALAFDGERERVLAPGQRATLSVRRDGPWVIDVPRVLARAAREGWLTTGFASSSRSKSLRASGCSSQSSLAIGADKSQ